MFLSADVANGCTYSASDFRFDFRNQIHESANWVMGARHKSGGWENCSDGRRGGIPRICQPRAGNTLGLLDLGKGRSIHARQA